MNNVGEQHRHLLVLRRCRGWPDRRAALVTELRVRRQFGATGRAQQSRCCHRPATVPNAVHVSIVSLLVNDVRDVVTTWSDEPRGPCWVAAPAPPAITVRLYP